MGAAIAAAIYARRAAVATEETVGIARDATEGASAALAIAERTATAAVEASQAGREANKLTRDAQTRARQDARWSAREARQRQIVADERAQAALDIAQRNAEAAASQVALSEATAQRQLRAYVGPQAINYTYDDHGGTGAGGFAASAEIINYGQTPALALRMLGSLNYRPFPITELPSIGLPEEATHTLFPTQKTYISVGLPVDAQRISELRTATGCFIFTIVVEYFDLSGQRHLETTRLYATNNMNLRIWDGTHTATMTFHSSEVH